MLAPRVVCRHLQHRGWLPAVLPARIHLIGRIHHSPRTQYSCQAMADDDLDALYEEYKPAPVAKPPLAHQRAAQQQQEQQKRKAEMEAAAARAHAAAPVVAASTRPPPLLVTRHIPINDLTMFNNAAFLIDKPLGWTSYDVCNAIKGALRPLGISKVGHAGTLDPNASGLLIVCTGTGTKSIDSFTSTSKAYSGTLRLGEATPSQDADTPVDATAPWEHIADADITAGAARLTGPITQVPPMYSAVHHEGRRLYELAREGATVERAGRPVTITSFAVTRDPQDPRCLRFAVECSKGTYIRALVADLGEGLGSLAHMTSLVRTASGTHQLEDAWQVQPLLDAIWQLVRSSGAVGRGGKPLSDTFTYTPRLKRSRSSSPEPGSEGEGQGLSRRAQRKQRRQQQEARAAAEAGDGQQQPSPDVATQQGDQAAAAPAAAAGGSSASGGADAAAAGQPQQPAVATGASGRAGAPS